MYEELEPTKFKYTQHSITVATKPNFDDIRNVQGYLRMKLAIKRATNVAFNNIETNLYGLGGLVNDEQ